MTRLEFATEVAWIAAGTRRALEPASQEVYYEMLRDVPLPVMRAAARLVIVDHVWATFPSIAELRAAVTQIRVSGSRALTPAECWAQAWAAAKRLDLDQSGPYRVRDPETGAWREYPSQEAFVLAGVPAHVAALMRAFGLRELAYSAEPLGVIRGQFLRMAEQRLDAETGRLKLPDAVRQAIDALAGGTMAAVAGPAGRLPAIGEGGGA